MAITIHKVVGCPNTDRELLFVEKRFPTDQNLFIIEQSCAPPICLKIAKMHKNFFLKLWKVFKVLDVIVAVKYKLQSSVTTEELIRDSFLVLVSCALKSMLILVA